MYYIWRKLNEEILFKAHQVVLPRLPLVGQHRCEHAYVGAVKRRRRRHVLHIVGGARELLLDQRQRGVVLHTVVRYGVEAAPTRVRLAAHVIDRQHELPALAVVPLCVGGNGEKARELAMSFNRSLWTRLSRARSC